MSICQCQKITKQTHVECLFARYSKETKVKKNTKLNQKKKNKWDQLSLGTHGR